jgi:ABC-type lipoprotein release transport system permease subunit
MNRFLALFHLSWKNVWRNRSRSLVVIMAVALGVGAGLFMSSFMYGMIMQLTKSELNNYLSHIQIHHEQFEEEPLAEYSLPNMEAIDMRLSQDPMVQQWVPRTIATGLASSSTGSFGVQINGVHPHQELAISELPNFLVEGSYAEGGLIDGPRNPIVVGKPLAKRLNLKLRSKVVLTTQDVEGELTASAFRVVGILSSPNANFDETQVFIPAHRLQDLLRDSTAVHEVAIRLNDFRAADSLALVLQEDFGSPYIAERWGDLSPTLRYSDSMIGTMLYIIMGIILIALSFGIINTMLMAVLERESELGMLMAIGLNPPRTFLMILMESIFLAMIGAPFGLFLAWLGIGALADRGIDLGAFAEGMSEYGFGTVIYPEMEPVFYLQVSVLIFITTVVASLFPSWKALKLLPVEAIRNH